MTDSEIRTMLQEVICNLPLADISENRDLSEEQLAQLTEVVKRYLPKQPEPPKAGEKKLFVGNLSYNTVDSDLTEWFEVYGDVQSAWIVTDRDTGRSKGFGFVEMGSEAEALSAVNGLNGKYKEGRALTVNVARPKAATDSKPAFKKNKRY